MKSKHRVASTYYFLDTSIFIETLKIPVKQVESKLASITPMGKRFATHYSIIEINKACLNSMLLLYKKVDELRDVPTAWAQMSNTFGRGSKYATLLNSLMQSYHESINHREYLIYLSQLEACIIDVQSRLESTVSDFIGSFSKHELGSFILTSSSDFDRHSELVKKHRSIDLSKFWDENEQTITEMRSYFSELSKNKKLNKDEGSVNQLVESLLTSPNLSHTHKGDLVISLECPKKHVLVAHDKIFEILVPAQSKSGGYVSLT